MKNLDFIVIGAQKSATTSLFRYLQKHPEIYLPTDKEAPFFSENKSYQMGWDAFAKTRFDQVSQNKLWGTVSPQYMYDRRVPARIARHMPNTKLIALLRNPVDRAFSHYRMAVRRGTENRSFAQAVDDLRMSTSRKLYLDSLKSDKEIELELKSREENYYLAWGEYGRILGHYLKHFNKEQILLIFMDDLQSDPANTMQVVLEFLNTNSQIIPTNIGKIYHLGGTKRIIPLSWKNNLRDLPGFRKLWHLVPDKSRSAINYWFEQLNVRKEATELIDSTTHSKLIAYFKADINLLESLCAKPIPWKQSHVTTLVETTL